MNRSDRIYRMFTWLQDMMQRPYEIRDKSHYYDAKDTPSTDREYIWYLRGIDDALNQASIKCRQIRNDIDIFGDEFMGMVGFTG